MSLMLAAKHKVDALVVVYPTSCFDRMVVSS